MLDSNGQSEIIFDSNDFTVLKNDIQNNIGVRLSALETKHDTDINTLTNTINNTINTKITAIETKHSEDIEELKKSVADGKALLASALRTKGKSTTNTATFEKIKQDILSIPTSVTVNNIAGTISYQYHYHTGSSSSRSGCYTTPVYHTHSGCSSGVCGETIYYYKVSGQPDYMLYATCSKGHTSSYNNKPNYYWESGHKGHCNGVAYYCGKTTSTIESYAPSCGYVDGQIIKAVITW